jgi:hypothetical protein
MDTVMSNKQKIESFGADEFTAVMKLIADYFDGLHHADVPTLRNIFHPDAFLKAPGLRRSLEEWLGAVANRPVPAQEGQAYSYRILSIEIIKDQAMVKLECPLFDHFYIDFLSLLKENGQWLIVNKMYTDLHDQVA